MTKYDLKISEPLIEAYPELSRFDEFIGDDSKLRFVIALLDADDKNTDLSKRIYQAAKIAGLKGGDELLDDQEIERMLCRYFVILNNETFETWLSKKVSFGEAAHQLRASISNTKDPLKATELKLKINELIEKLRTDILKLERTLFKDPLIERKIKESTSNRVIHYAERFAESDTVE